MQDIGSYVQTFFKQSDFYHHTILSVITIASLWISNKIVFKLAQRHLKDMRLTYVWRKGVSYFFTAIGVFLIGRIWFQGVESIATFLGLFSAGLAIALKDFFMGLAGWIFILLKGSFVVGDRIQVGDVVGDVVDIGILKVTLLEVGNWVDATQSTGRLVRVPNARFLTENIANSHSGFPYIWHEIPILLTFESDWEKAKEQFIELLKRITEPHQKDIERYMNHARRNHMIYFNKSTPTVYTTVRDSGILLTMRFLCDPKMRRNIEQDIWETLLRESAGDETIDLAYPTTRHIVT